jgi:hypothetical protein
VANDDLALRVERLAAERLFAFDQPNPLARDDDAVAQPGRSSTAESAAFLKANVDKVLKATGASKVVLIGNSRGGNTIRNYVQNGGGAAVVSQVVLGGNPAHGIWAVKGFRENNEFSGLSGFMQQLNAPKGANGDEVTPGVKWLTLRSDNNDKYAQPDGVWIGAPGKPTNIGFDGPALKGATNVVLPRVDHRETSFSPAAFAATWQFLTGQAPRSTDVAAEATVVLNGRALGAENLALTARRVTVYAVDPATGARLGEAVHTKIDRRRRALGPFQGAQRHGLRIRPGRARLRHHAHLPQPVPARRQLRAPASPSASLPPTTAQARWSSSRARAGISTRTATRCASTARARRPACRPRARRVDLAAAPGRRRRRRAR